VNERRLGTPLNGGSCDDPEAGAPPPALQQSKSAPSSCPWDYSQPARAARNRQTSTQPDAVSDLRQRVVCLVELVALDQHQGQLTDSVDSADPVRTLNRPVRIVLRVDQ
jgi:hypothetical protein